MKLRKPKKADPVASAKKPAPPAKRSEPTTPNPPRTTTGWLTSPKFGNAGSGGAEFEPGPDLD